MALAIRFLAACGACLFMAGAGVVHAQDPQSVATGTSASGAGNSRASVSGSVTTSVSTVNSPGGSNAATQAAASSGSVLSPSPVSSGPTTLSQGGGISILGYVVTVIVLAAASVAVLLRGGFVGMFSGPSKAQRKLHIEESRSLGHRQHLVVASYEGRRFLLGVCPGSIEYLSGLDAEPLSPAGSFQELLASDPSASESPKSPVNKADPHKDAP